MKIMEGCAKQMSFKNPNRLKKKKPPIVKKGTPPSETAADKVKIKKSINKKD